MVPPVVATHMTARGFRCFIETKWTMGTKFKPGDVVAVPSPERIAALEALREAVALLSDYRYLVCSQQARDRIEAFLERHNES
jgi:organic radical activating enzyme